MKRQMKVLTMALGHLIIIAGAFQALTSNGNPKVTITMPKIAALSITKTLTKAIRYSEETFSGVVVLNFC